jgi:hypothetical protein
VKQSKSQFFLKRFGLLRLLEMTNRPENKTGHGAIRGRFVEALSKAVFAAGKSQLVLISTSLVSGRKKKPTTAVIDAKMIGYQRPA